MIASATVMVKRVVDPTAVDSCDFIGLDTGISPDHPSEDNIHEEMGLVGNGDMLAICEEHAPSIPSEEVPVLIGSACVAESLAVSENVHRESNGRRVIVSDRASTEHLIDEIPLAGTKRPRLSVAVDQPSVRVVYNSLTRESKKKLMELMQKWSEWHAKSQSSDLSSEALENGEEIYFPALHIGSEKSLMVSFWIDNQGSREETRDAKLNNDSIPFYDRGFNFCSTSDPLIDPGRIEAEDSRCFNCGSYSHSLKECQKPRDNVAITNARKQFNSRRNLSSNSHGQDRYYKKTPGKFDDLIAGVLGPETRESLGIGEFDPPPWLHRMRELGYPPGYLDVVEDGDQPSGITIVGEEKTKAESEEGELPESGEPESYAMRMTVKFPGINAPIPEGANKNRWSSQSENSGSSNRRSHSLSNHHQQESSRRHHHLHDHHHDYYAPSSSSFSTYSPSYSPYERRSLSSPQPPPPGTEDRYYSLFDRWNPDARRPSN